MEFSPIKLDPSVTGGSCGYFVGQLVWTKEGNNLWMPPTVQHGEDASSTMYGVLTHDLMSGKTLEYLDQKQLSSPELVSGTAEGVLCNEKWMVLAFGGDKSN